MARKYPVGIQDFDKIISQQFLYIDKTHLVYDIAKRGGYYFLSRPRRFGKSLLLSTLHYLYLGRKELFEGLYIYDRWDWSSPKPVIKISFSNIGHKDKGLRVAINDELDSIASKYDIELKDNYNSGKFKELIEKLSIKQGKVVVLIDEYDKPIIDYLGTNTEAAVENCEILKSFYSILKDADSYLELVFITGVSKFSRVSIFSDLNNLYDISTDTNFETVCGISQEELETNFVEELKITDKQEVKRWYNGYSWGGGNKVYNPFSLLHFFAGDGRFKNYWFETGTPTFLINLAKKSLLYNFENERISPSQLNAYDLENLQIIPLMFQTGYLTIKDYDEMGGIYTLDYPNLEVRRSYLEYLIDSYIQSQKDRGSVVVYDIRAALLACDMTKLQLLINALFKAIPYTIWQNENEHFYHAILHLTFRLLNIYVQSEVQSADGRLDALVQIDKYVYCFEFKLDGNAAMALQQIKDKGYLEPYMNDGKTCIGIGLNFSKTDKKVEKLIWEQF